MSKKEFTAWCSQHAGERQFEIFHRDGEDAVVDFAFWARSREAAVEELELFRQKQRLIAPSGDVKYFYREVNNYCIARRDGTYAVCREPTDLTDCVFEEDRRPALLEKLSDFVRSVAWKMRDVKNILRDIAFWLGHYDVKTCHGEERNDYWSVDETVLRKLLFNIPRLAKSRRGCPSQYVAETVFKTRAAAGNPITMDQAYKVQATPAEMEAAGAAWEKELDELVLYVRLYKYYDAGGRIQECDGREMTEIDKKYRCTLPFMPGTENELDIAECEKLAQKYWDLYCDQWKKIGRMCWD